MSPTNSEFVLFSKKLNHYFIKMYGVENIIQLKASPEFIFKLKKWKIWLIIVSWGENKINILNVLF